jgi:cytochrome P450
VSDARQPTAKEISKANLPYLDAVIEEVLRIGQPTPVVAREAMVDTILLGHPVSKGTNLFNPDRWLKKDETGDIVYDSQAGPFLSFSLGPRGCFGRRLAYLEMRMVLTLLLWNFKFRKLEGELASYKTVEAVTVMPKFCYVGLERIN